MTLAGVAAGLASTGCRRRRGWLWLLPLVVVVSLSAWAAMSPPAAEAIAEQASLEVFIKEAGWEHVAGAPIVGSLGGRVVPWEELKSGSDVEGEGYSGMTPEKLATLMGIPLGHLTGMQVWHSAEPAVSLDREEVLEENLGVPPYFEGEGEETATSAVSFVMPEDTGRPVRVGSGDEPGAAIQVAFTIEGVLLDVVPHIKIKPKRPEAGQTVQFGLPGLTSGKRNSMGEPTDSYSYLWDFGDGTTSTAPEPAHSFPSAAANGMTQYDVSVEVTAYDSEGVLLSSGFGAVTVPVTTTGKSAAPPVGPEELRGGAGLAPEHVKRRETGNAKGSPGGGRAGGKGGASSPGEAGLGREPAHNGPRGGPAGGHGSPAPGAGTGAPEPEGPAQPQSSPTPAQTTPPRVTHAHKPPPRHAPPPEKPSKPTPRPKPRPKPSEVQQEQGLEGVLLSAVSSVLPPTAIVEAAAPSSSAGGPLGGLPPTPPVPGLGVLAVIAGVLAAVALLLSGVLGELLPAWRARRRYR